MMLPFQMGKANRIQFGLRFLDMLDIWCPLQSWF